MEATMRDLPMPGLAGEQDGLTLTLFRAPPTAQQYLDLPFAPDQGAELGRAQCLETALHGARPQRLPDLHWRRHAPDRDGADVAVFEEIADQTPCLARDHNGAGLGKALQAGCEVRRFADDAPFLRLPTADKIADNDQAGSDADAASHFADRSRP
jgi:hypothetical protein